MNGEPPEVVKRLDLFIDAARIAHETIWGLYRRLIEEGRDEDLARQRLQDAARLGALEIPALVRHAVGLRRRWVEQDLLDPRAAEVTLRELDRELGRITPELERLRSAQNEIARELRDRLRRR